ncbi:Flp family type IVb pilin [Peptoclostridium acidaminophilum]|nr:Flp family type IVb pilin [Peptoclostridium acidaminophilum]
MLRYFMDYVRFNVLKNEEGQGLVEYALIIVLVAIVVAAALGLMEEQITAIFANITTKLTPP